MRLEKMAAMPQIVAIGEAGIDLNRGPALFSQIEAFRAQALLAKRLGKPLMIHCVKAYENILSLHAEIKPQQPWILHGFRAKPTVADMFIRKEFYLSFGEKFNAESVAATPPEKLLAETDESPLTIEEIIEKIQAFTPYNTLNQIIHNMKKILILAAIMLASLSLYAQDDNRAIGVQNNEDYTLMPFHYQGYVMQIPTDSQIEMNTKEAVIKNAKMKYGVSIKLEKDEKANLQRATTLCETLCKDLGLKDAKIESAKYAGLSGVQAVGQLEGARVQVVLLDSGKSYMKIILITDPTESSLAATILSSLTRNQ